MVSPNLLFRFVTSEFRRSWFRFVFVIIAFATGIGILVAISGVKHNIAEAIALEAKSLLAADLSINSSAPLEASVRETVPGNARIADEITFASMLSTAEAQNSRLVQVRALQGAYPFYGIPKVTPEFALRNLQSGDDASGALIDRSIAQQLGISVGTSITIGRIPFVVRGIIEQFPGETYARTIIAPKVLVPLASVQGSELLQRGSRLTYKLYVALDNASAITALEQRLKELQPQYRFEIDTVERRKQSLGRVLNNVHRFLTLVSVAAVLLGGLGVGSAMMTFIRSRASTIASLRCLGVTRKEVAVLFGAQSLMIAALGAVVGTLAGAALCYLLPTILYDFLPVAVTPDLPLVTLAQGFFIAFTVGGFFCAWPLTGVFSIPPSAAIRGGDLLDNKEISLSGGRGRGVLFFFGILALIATTSFLLESFLVGSITSAILLLLCGVLGGVSWVCMRVVRLWRPDNLPFAIRYGLAALGRPQSQTGVVVVTLGIATFLVGTISLTHTSLLDQVSVAGSGTRPNLVLFDVQPDQREGVRTILLRHQLAVQQEVPIVTMRLAAINELDNRELRADTEIPEWTLRREYRSSYRDQLIESERLVAGRFVPEYRWSGDPNMPIPVTVEEGIAEDLKIKVGDKVRFDVQGVLLLTEVVGVRRVDWRRVQTNFFFLFPAGVLEEAPQFFAMMTRANTLESLAAVQRDVISAYGNISAIDLNLILETADTVLSKVAVAVQFLALFTIVSGLCILAGALATTRAARLKELLLLKAVGATRKQTITITIVEFMLLATLSALVGVGASLVGGWAIATWYFESSFAVPWNELLLLYGALLLAVFAVGIVMTLGLLRISPIEVLRSYQG